MMLYLEALFSLSRAFYMIKQNKQHIKSTVCVNGDKNYCSGRLVGVSSRLGEVVLPMVPGWAGGTQG